MPELDMLARPPKQVARSLVQVRKAVTAVGQQIRSENGAAAGADSFHRQAIQAMLCPARMLEPAHLESPDARRLQISSTSAAIFQPVQACQDGLCMHSCVQHSQEGSAYGQRNVWVASALPSRTFQG